MANLPASLSRWTRGHRRPYKRSRIKGSSPREEGNMLPRMRANSARRAAAVLCVFAGALLLNTRLTAQKPRLTEKDILPIMQRCFQCHGERLQTSDLDLHTRAG